MKRNFLSWFLILCLLMSIIPFGAFTVGAETYGYYTYEIRYGEAIITDVNQSISGDVVIPDTLGGYPVTSIGEWAFAFCVQLTGIKIPESVRKIEYKAFCESGITSVEIPNSVVKIGERAFQHCGNLTNVTIGSGVAYIGASAFYGYSKITNIVVDENNGFYCSADGVLFNKNVTMLIQYPIEKSDELYTIPDTVTSICDDAFFACEGLKNIVFPDNLESIGDAAFESCSSLKNISLPDGITNIGRYAFNNTAYYNDTSNWEDKVLYIGKYLIEANYYLEGKYSVKDGTLIVADYAFMDCENIKSITIPNSVTNIGQFAFSGCDNLIDINIADGVTSIGDAAFSGTAYYNDDSNWQDKILYIGNYLIAAENDIICAVIPDGVKCIGDNAFDECWDITSITIPNSVISIGDNAFVECWGITSITIPNSVISIGSCAFGWTSVESITIPSSVKNIGDNLFGNCNSLSGITVDENNKNYCSVDGVLFDKNMTTLIQYPAGKTGESYVVPDTVTSINDTAFFYCDESLKNVTVGTGVTNIGSNAFSSMIVVFGYRKSIIETYAKANDIAFWALNAIISGDINDDSTVNNKDLGLLMQYLNNWKVQITINAADVNGDGNINNKDYGLLMQYINNWKVELQ